MNIKVYFFFCKGFFEQHEHFAQYFHFCFMKVVKSGLEQLLAELLLSFYYLSFYIFIHNNYMFWGFKHFKTYQIFRVFINIRQH